jgi:hypothetical protein
MRRGWDIWAVGARSTGAVLAAALIAQRLAPNLLVTEYGYRGP